MNNYFNGSVPMRPEIEKKDFVSDGDISYQVPKVYFGCTGEKGDLPSVLDWSDEFLLVVRDSLIMKYTESTFCETLVKETDENKKWMPATCAAASGCKDENVKGVAERKLYTVEEYDFDKFEKRKYKVVFEETSSIDDFDYCMLKYYVDKNGEYNSACYTLTES